MEEQRNLSQYVSSFPGAVTYSGYHVFRADMRNRSHFFFVEQLYFKEITLIPQAGAQTWSIEFVL